MSKKRKNTTTYKPLLLFCLIAGIATLVLRMLNRRMQVPELGEIAGYTGTAFAIALVLIIGIWLIAFISKK